MCGRFTLRTPVAELAEIFEAAARPDLAARYNIAPGQDILVARAAAGGDGGREFAMLRWGLVPHWAKDPAMAARLINARAETVAEKPSFRDSYRRRRCLVPADGFYEWRKRPDGATQPYHLHLNDDAPFAIAGLWDSWRAPDGDALETCALITTEANRILEPIHHRMPVILPRDAYQSWLDEHSSPDMLEALLRPYGPDDLEAVSVSPRVNNAGHDDASCLDEVESGLLL